MSPKSTEWLMNLHCRSTPTVGYTLAARSTWWGPSRADCSQSDCTAVPASGESDCFSRGWSYCSSGAAVHRKACDSRHAPRGSSCAGAGGRQRSQPAASQVIAIIALRTFAAIIIACIYCMAAAGTVPIPRHGRHTYVLIRREAGCVPCIARLLMHAEDEATKQLLRQLLISLGQDVQIALEEAGKPSVCRARSTLSIFSSHYTGQ